MSNSEVELIPDKESAVSPSSGDNKSTAHQFCDVVMKGGLTSGVVYPLAICALAQTYHFKNVGGASAGAIAAAAAAAAEYRRANGFEDGFEELRKLPTELEGGTVEKLFQPQRKTLSLYKLVLAFIGRHHWVIKLGKAITKLFLFFPLGSIIGALPGLAAIIVIQKYLASPLPAWLWLVLLLLLIALPSFLFALLNVVVQAIWAIPANNYGLCGGSGAKKNHKALTDWMSDKFENIAKKGQNSNGPLTFNDLWSAGRSDELSKQANNEREINLEIMTTNLTFGRPYRIPFTADEPHLFYFKSSEFRHLFPKEIVDYMESTPPHGRGDDKYWALMAPEYFPFPNPGALPIVVAVRMSLSFPILISAVPLYTVDWSRKENQDAMKCRRRPELEKCLFSDGGISSNFPIHFFDSPIPRWPTFAIYLGSFQRGERPSEIECENIFMSKCNNPNQFENWNRFDDRWWRLGGFVGAIVNTMENWRDQTQARVPGYRDRIATIHMSPDEGGINLNMPTDVVRKLSLRGECAGELLRQRFDPHEDDRTGLNWENQRWIRFRSFMSTFENMLARFKLAYEYDSAGVPSYAEMVYRGGVFSSQEPPRFCGDNDKSPFTDSQLVSAEEKTKRLLELATFWEAAKGGQVRSETFGNGAPKPPAELSIRPKV